MPPIDLRSDTVTRPTPGMRAAMAAAEVGDDVYGEDPTVRALEAEVAALLGKERALFVPSGTMSNQLALLAHCERGDEVVVGEGAHCAWYESGAAAAWAGVQLSVAGRGGCFDEADLLAAVKPPAYYFPRTRLVWVENTHNKAGGTIFAQEAVLRVAAAARRLGLALHLDGARLWNAAAASGVTLEALAAPFDTVSVCFSKGLGAPVGSALVGSAPLLERAHRLRKMLGGGMRQVGVLAAAARYALHHQRERLVEDHAAARAVAAVLAGAPGLARVAPPATNIVACTLAEGVVVEHLVQAARDEGVLVGAMDARTLRAVTHLDVPEAAAVEGAARLLRALGRVAGEPAGRAGATP